MKSFLPRLDSPKTVPLFVPLLGAYPVAFLASRNAGQFSALTALLVTALLVVGVLGLYALFRWRTRNKVGAGVGAVFVVVMFFTFPLFVSWIGRNNVPPSALRNRPSLSLTAPVKLPFL